MSSAEPLMTLQEHLRTGQGLRTFARATLKLFEDRVECTEPGLIGGGSTDSIRYEQIAHVVVDRGFRWATLAAQTTGGGGFSVGGLKKDEADAAKALIEERVAAFRAPPPVAVPADGPSVAEQIAQLAALRDSGALTEEEFTAAKARLLGESA